MTSRLTRFRYIDARRTAGPVRRKVRSRGVPPPALAGHEIFYTEDVRSAAQMVGKVLSPGSLTLADPPVGDGFAASLFGVRLRDVSMLYLDLTVAATLDIPVLGPYFTICMPTNGRVMCRGPDSTIEANTVQALVTSPGPGVRLEFGHDSPVLVIRIEEPPTGGTPHEADGPHTATSDRVRARIRPRGRGGDAMEHRGAAAARRGVLHRLAGAARSGGSVRSRNC